MNDAEMEQWWKHYSSSLPSPRLEEEQRLLVESLTGRIPLLLRALFQFEGKPFNEHQFLASTEIAKVWDDIHSFYQRLKEGPSWSAQAELYYEIMSGCLQHAEIPIHPNHLYDHRYLYIEGDIGNYTCAVAFRAMTAILRDHRFMTFRAAEWYTAVELSSNNPVMQGFMAEHICLSRIAAEGLKVVDQRLTKMDHAVFQVLPRWQDLLSSDHTCCLYVPTSFNFPAVDGAILLLDHKKKIAHLFPLQITLSLRHRDSDATFYAQKWRSWTKGITEAGFTNIATTFVWIDKKQPSSEAKPKVSRTTRQGTTAVHPGYQSIHVGIKDIDPTLAKRLGIS